MRTLSYGRGFNYTKFEVFKLEDRIEIDEKLSPELAQKVMLLLALNIEISYLKIKEKVDELASLGTNPADAFAYLEAEKLDTMAEISRLSQGKI